jgi:signal transduction histidine kinase
MGYLYYMMGDLDSSYQRLQQAVKIYQAIDDKSGLSGCYNLLGKLYLKKNDYEAAGKMFNSSLALAVGISVYPMIIENYKSLSQLYSLSRNYQKAFDYQQKFITLSDSLMNIESQKKVLEMQFIYERERKEQENELLRRNKEIQDLAFENQRIQRNFLLIGIILIISVLFLMYSRFLSVSATNKKLEHQKNEISETNQKLLLLNKDLMEQKQKVEELNRKLNDSNQKLQESERHLINTNKTKDKFFSIISHDLRNPFASIVSFSRILKREIHDMSKDELSDLALELDKSVLKINNLLENLLQWSRAQTGKINYHPGYIAIKEIVRENTNLFGGNAREKNIQIQDLIEEDLVVFADANMTNTVIRNLVSNALKYTHSGGHIVLSSRKSNGKVFISVADNGVGISREDIKKLLG